MDDDIILGMSDGTFHKTGHSRPHIREGMGKWGVIQLVVICNLIASSSYFLHSEPFIVLLCMKWREIKLTQDLLQV